MKKTIYILSIFIILVICCYQLIHLAKDGDISDPNSVIKPEYASLAIVREIKIEELYKNAISFKFIPNSNDRRTNIWYHDGTGLTINKFTKQGKHLNTISLPSINEPIGINRITDFFVYSKDSVFVYDAQYRKLLLVNEQSELLSLWLINNYVPELSPGRNNEIIDVYKNKKGELKIDLSGYANTYYKSDPLFFQRNSLVYQINLTSKEVSRGISYPENSAYRDYQFWSGVIPYVRKTDKGYMAVFPLDEQIYWYTADLRPLLPTSTLPENFPRARGNAFGEGQKMNFARIDRKLNGFNLKVRGMFESEQGKTFARVYRAPLGDNDDIPDDYASFLKGDYHSDHFLQIFTSVGGKITKQYRDMEISRLGLGNLLHIDDSGHFYFLKNDPESEQSVVVVCKVSPPLQSPYSIASR
jgi:hypothetical protein